jgi:K+-sensing histidine kinase KdpD
MKMMGLAKMCGTNSNAGWNNSRNLAAPPTVEQAYSLCRSFTRTIIILLDAAQGRTWHAVRPLAIVMLTFTPDRSMSTLVRTGSRSRLLLAVALCGGLALGLSLFFRDSAVKPAVPAIFVLVIISVAHFWGRLASLLVAVVGGFVFAAFLFEPYGSLAVTDAADRLVLFWFVVCAIVAVRLSTRPPGN